MHGRGTEKAMDQLADQASDLRSFIGHEGGSTVTGYSTGNPVAHHLPPPLGPGPTAMRSPAPAGSAFGDNSAHYQQHHTTHHQPQHNASFSGSPTASETASGKRKAEDEDGGSTKQQRSKRNRYISIACNECKRRKIKCNGQTPCQRCGNLNLQCLYAPNCCPNNVKDSDEFRQLADHVGELQEQVNRLMSNMNDLRQETLRLAPIQGPILPLPSSVHTPSPSTSSFRSLSKPPYPSHPRVNRPSFHGGPTSINFTVDMAKNTLHSLGYPVHGDANDDPNTQPGETPAVSPTLRPMLGTASPALQLAPRDPLWDFDKDEMVRLCQVHQEEVGLMYPVIKIEKVIQDAKFLATWMEAAKRNGQIPPQGTPEGISELSTLIVKIVLCCALVCEEHGNSTRATQLFESMSAIIDRKLMSERADINDMPFLALVSGYRFLANDEVLAWRTIGQVARLCMELGLHRREGLANIQDESERREAVDVFWTAYVLDRRWSFMTGLPYVCHDDMIDPGLPMPDNHHYLTAMITYSRLGAKIWKLVDYFEPAVIRDLRAQDFEDLDREILDWYETVPAEIRVSPLDRELPIPHGPNYDTRRLQVWTKLRLYQMRIWLHTPILHSASSIADNMPLAQRVVDLAKDTIVFLTWLNNKSNLYRRIQVFYHQFLTSAIAVLFLASTHAPLQFSRQCRNEFYMGLELIKDMSARSWVSQRLWRAIKSLKAYAPGLGLQELDSNSIDQQQQQQQLHGPNGPCTSVAYPRAPAHNNTGLPNGPYATGGRQGGSSGSTPSNQQQQQQQQGGSVAEDANNGTRLKTEMSMLFDGYMGLNGGRQAVASSATQAHLAPATARGDANGRGAGSPKDGEGVYRHLKDLF